MQATLLLSFFCINFTLADWVTWGRNKSTIRKKREADESIKSYKYFLTQANNYFGVNVIKSNFKNGSCYYYNSKGGEAGGCYFMEYEAPGRNIPRNQDEKKIYTIEEEEPDLKNIIKSQVPDINNIQKNWGGKVDKVIISLKEPPKCELVYFPIETIGMTVASDGSVSNSQIEESTTGSTWEKGVSVKAKTPEINPIGTFSLEVSHDMSVEHSKLVSGTKEETFSNKFPSSCTPSLITAGVLCHPIDAMSFIRVGNFIIPLKEIHVPQRLIPNRNGDLFDKLTDCIDYLHDDDEFMF